MNWPRPRKSLAIARVEYRRSLRAMTNNPVRLLPVLVVVVLFAGVSTVGGAYVAYRFGDRILGVVPVLGGARGGFPVAWLFLTFTVGSRTLGKTGRIEHEDGMLTTVPAADVAGGLLTAEAARLLSVIAVPLVVIPAALSVAVGAPSAFVTIVVAALAAFSTAVLVGHLVGLLVKTVFGQSELLTRYKSVIAVLVFVAYLVAVSSSAFTRFVAELSPLLQATPMAWFGDLLVAGIPRVSPSLPRVVGAILVFVVGVPVLLALDVRVATRLWYGDRAQPSARRHTSSGASWMPRVSSAAFLGRVTSGPTRTVTAKVWRRTVRSPFRLLYVAYPLIFLITPIQQAVTTGAVPTSLPVLLAACGTWAVGAAALNPFGDEGALLPVTLTTPVRGGEFVRGHLLAVTPIGLPVIVVVTAITGVLSPLSPTSWVSLAVVSGVLTLVGPVVALAVGTAFPRFGTARITRGRRVVVPSKTAFVVYTVILALGFLGGVVAVVPLGADLLAALLGFVAGLLGFGTGISAPALRLVGGGVALALAVVAPPVAYRYVVGRFESYTLA